MPINVKDLYQKSIEKDNIKRVLLLSPFREPYFMVNARCDFKSWSGTQWYPIQLGYLACFLKSRSYEVKIVDAQAYGMDDEDTGREIAKFKPHYIVLYASNKHFESDMRMAESLNNNICPTILAGPFYALNADYYRVPGIQGELEDGVIAWIEGKIKTDKPIVGEPLTSEQLDRMPFVSDIYQEQLDPKYYRTPSEPWPFVDIMTGRGCFWGQCTFCLWPKVYKKGYAARSMDNVIAEVEKIEKKGFYKSIMIEDDTFPEPRIDEFCHRKLYKRLTIPWSCLVRANLSVPTLRVMKKADCLNLHVGYESGCDNILARIKKGITKEEMYKFTRNAQQEGLQIHGDFMIGIDDTEKEIKETINWACRLNPNTAQFQIYIPYDGKKIAVSPERRERLAQYAYRKFYSRPGKWPVVAKQILKPAVLKESFKSVMGVRR